MRTTLSTVLLCALASGAALGGSPREALVQLDRAEALWRSAPPGSYSFTVEYSEFIGQFGCFSQIYVVQGNLPSGVAPSDCKYSPDKLGTVLVLFKLMRQTLRRTWDEVTVEFDQALGYPKHFYVGSKDIVDDYFQLTVSQFEVAPNKSPERTRAR